MAARKTKNIALRTLVLFIVLLIALSGVFVSSNLFSSGSWLPKLAIDLEGGTQLILTPKQIDGSKGTITDEDINQAISVIRQRVDASGVAEAEINRSGTENITVSLPGTPSEDTLNLIRSSAVMRFRTVLQVAPGNAVLKPSKDAKAASKTGNNNKANEQKKGDSKGEKSPKVKASPAPSMSLEQLRKEASKYSNDAKKTPTGPLDQAWITPRDKFLFENLDCSEKSVRTAIFDDKPKEAIVACEKNGAEKYILGPAVLEGSDIDTATSGMQLTQQGQTTGKWVVNLSLKQAGAKAFDDIAKVLYKNFKGEAAVAPANNRFAIVLDGLVISAPGINAPSFGGRAEISGSFTRESAATLAHQLQFGSLPLNFELQSEQRISATLGSEHLKIGFYAAIVGLVLVMLFLLWQYHALSVVAISSLILAGTLTYLTIAVLSWSMGYRLSLAGVVGLIVSVGITMDSFIVYFERIRDEVREGRPLVSAVDAGWERAKRTILISDAVNLVAAIVLYTLAVGGVQGFAFTLGLTTAIDLVIIFLFTHPVMAMIIRTHYFGSGSRFSGLDPVHLGTSSDRTYLAALLPAKKVKGSSVSTGVSLARAKQARLQAKKGQLAASEKDTSQPDVSEEKGKAES